jgi:phage-related protein
MSKPTYYSPGRRKPSIWLVGTLKTPPLSPEARNRGGTLIRRVQMGEKLAMPLSRPMPEVGERCHEIRFGDGDTQWRIIYRIDVDAVVVAEFFQKTTRTTPRHVIDLCRWRLKRYDLRGKER